MDDLILRKARMADVKTIHKLLLDCSQQSLLLPRSLSQLYSHLRDFYVVSKGEDGPVMGCCALSLCWDDLGEIRSLAIEKECMGAGLGSKLVQACLQDAADLGLKRVFTLTYVVDFFAKLGFEKVEKDTLPQKVWSDCVNCPKFPECDETAMLHMVNSTT